MTSHWPSGPAPRDQDERPGPGAPRSWSSPPPARGVPEKVAEQDATRRERQRRRHVEHGALGRMDARLPKEDLHAVGHGFDARVGAAAEGVGPKEDEQQESTPGGPCPSRPAGGPPQGWPGAVRCGLKPRIG